MPRVIFRKRDPLSLRIYRSPYTKREFVTVYGHSLVPGEKFETRYWNGKNIVATGTAIVLRVDKQDTPEGVVLYWEDVPEVPTGLVRTLPLGRKFMRLID